MVSVRPDDREAVLRLAADCGVKAALVGRTCADRIRIAVAGVTAIDCTIAEAERIWTQALGQSLVVSRSPQDGQGRT